MKALTRTKPKVTEIPARKTRDAQFEALLRRKCTRAASVGALTAAAESIPGLGRVARLLFGELLDAKLLATIQRELIEETFALYELDLPAAAKSTLVEKVQILGTGASVTGDAFLRATLKRVLGKVGGLVVSRVVPLVPIVTSASTNAAVTYAIGKRAQAVAQLRDASMADTVRAFTGVDERRVFEWTSGAVKNALGLVGKALSAARDSLRAPRRRR